MNRSYLAGMIGFLAFSSSVFACSDDSCYPGWNLKRDMLDTCNNIPFLSPANDSRVNLKLFWSDHTNAPLQSDADTYYADQGYALVPFPTDRVSLVSVSDSTDTNDKQEQPNNALIQLLKDLHVSHELLPVISQATDWSGSRCISNNLVSTEQFLQQLQAADISEQEKQVLADTRLQILQNCNPELLQQADWKLSDVTSDAGKVFADYLNGSIAFYSGDFTTASQIYAQLSQAAQPWIKETAQYMTGRTLLNAAQQHAFDEMGYPSTENTDKTQLAAAKSAFQAYLTAYPSGVYQHSATGLMRRIDWLAGDETSLANDYAEQMKLASTDRAIDDEALIQEIDNKLLMSLSDINHIQDPVLLASVDLMKMRHRYDDDTQPVFTLAQLEAQSSVFAEQPALFRYLKAAYAFYVDKDAKQTLNLLQADTQAMPSENPDYVQFSLYSLKGFALENTDDTDQAAALWQSMLKQKLNPLQHQQVELALAMNYERNQKLNEVFAAHSPIKTSMIRQNLLRNIANADLLRQQIKKPFSSQERDVALFTLLYKDLYLGQYDAYLRDITLLPETPDTKPLYMGYAYPQQTLALFHWTGENTQEYQCPALTSLVQTLKNNPNEPKALNCLGDFVLRNGLDDFPLNEQPDEDELGGTPSLFTGKTFSRLSAYQQIIADKSAPHSEQAYALFRAINCFARSGINNCDAQDIPVEQRKQWFQSLKSRYKDTPWGQSQKYYW